MAVLKKVFQGTVELGGWACGTHGCSKEGYSTGDRRTPSVR